MTTVQEYYNRCYSDYGLIWHSNRTLALHAGFYDNGERNHDKAVLRMNEVLAAKAKITSADKVLDAGCGIGGSAIWLAKNIGCQVTAVDINDKYLGAAARLANKNGVGGLITLHNMDFSCTSFPDNSFDVIWAIESSCHAVDKLAFLKEAKRLLKAHGRVVVADGFVTDGNIHPDVKKWLNGWVVPNLASVAQFNQHLNELGFENISFEDATENVMPSSKRLYWAGITLYPLGKLLELLKIRTKVQTANIISAIYQHTTLVKGLWKYGVFMAERVEWKEKSSLG